MYSGSVPSRKLLWRLQADEWTVACEVESCAFGDDWLLEDNEACFVFVDRATDEVWVRLLPAIDLAPLFSGNAKGGPAGQDISNGLRRCQH